MKKRRVKTDVDPIPVTRGSGNVFADIGLPNPEEHLAKAQLVSMIDDVSRNGSSRNNKRRRSWGSISQRCRACCEATSGASPRSA
jgi:hypothetical protein